MAEFQEQVMGLTGLTIDNSSTNPSRAEFTTFLTDGAKEIINILPKKLKEKCITETILSNSPTSMDVDGFGDITSVVRRNSDSGYWISCRKVSKEYSSSATDSTSLHYATETDPVYYIQSQSDAVALFVKPTPTANQTAFVYHISYPSVAYNNSTIANFPDEAEYLVTLYAAIKSLQSTMGAMNASIVHSDQDGTYSASSSSSQGWEKVRDWLETEEDSEMSASTMQALSSEMQQFAVEYQWYQAQQLKLQQDYDKGIQMLVGGGIPKPTKEGSK